MVDSFQSREELMLPSLLHAYNSVLNVSQTVAAKKPLESFVVQCLVRHHDAFDCLDYFEEFVSDRYGTCYKLQLNKIEDLKDYHQSGFLWGAELLLYLPEDKWANWMGESYSGARVTLSHPHHPSIPEESGADVFGGQFVTIEYDEKNMQRDEDEGECFEEDYRLRGSHFSQPYTHTLCTLYAYTRAFEKFQNCSASR